jgi:hypothetical protein
VPPKKRPAAISFRDLDLLSKVSLGCALFCAAAAAGAATWEPPKGPIVRSEAPLAELEDHVEIRLNRHDYEPFAQRKGWDFRLEGGRRRYWYTPGLELKNEGGLRVLPRGAPVSVQYRREEPPDETQLLALSAGGRDYLTLEEGLQLERGRRKADLWFMRALSAGMAFFAGVFAWGAFTDAR